MELGGRRSPQAKYSLPRRLVLAGKHGSLYDFFFIDCGKCFAQNPLKVIFVHYFVAFPVGLLSARRIQISLTQTLKSEFEQKSTCFRHNQEDRCINQDKII